MTYTAHYSVLKKECLDSMYADWENSNEEKLLFADLTFGGGGHSLAIVARDERANLISFDQDPDALANGRKLIEESGNLDRHHLVDSNFCHFGEVVKNNFQELVDECGGFSAILMDLGVSSHHFDEGNRGFSFRVDAPLDMRMDSDNDKIQTAKDIVNKYSELELEKIFKEFGEEKFSRRIAQRIAVDREKKPIETTFELAELIKQCYPAKLRYGRINPATKCFQALRIEVNRELHVLSEVIPQIIPLLKINGKICVISFHSLEDRIVKHEFKRLEKDNDDIICEVVTKKPILPSDQELDENPRSRSAKLRVIKRVEARKQKNKYAKFSTIK
ncbi:16S rRNA (cytosine(1402)-N(4))-methyltransferase RsmH [Bacteriovorax sp. DB6_IX]|uniref:16S rRNA (cytosine(1402)-N(4))-methyltransferase RsmH n=1 Tax=Bacteriovorax sp. DB6_IX TaxID=1353530 RepID=UPI0004164697|nr:16S rRNA (cytosine(1402)-N(4))-methyltransferase RsmH [Bacteriovorax sp. DB6_IX]